MITNIQISHYKSITDVSVPLGAINVLVGKNGSGKSNIIDAITFLRDIASDDLDYAMTKRHGSDSVRQYSKFKPYNITLTVDIETEKGNGCYKLILSSSRNYYKIIEEFIEWNGETTYSGSEKYRTTLRRQAGKPLNIDSDYPHDDINFDDIRNAKIDPHEAILSQFKGKLYSLHWILGYVVREIRGVSAFSIFPNTIRSPQAASRGAVLDADGGNIASIIKQLPPERRRRIIRSLKSVIGQIENISVKSTAGYYVPVFVVSNQGREQHELNMSQISDGTLRVLGILTALFQTHAPSKIILEEPEQMIHPALLIVIRDAILDYLNRKPGGQVIITTHSSVLIDLFDSSHILAVESEFGSTKCGKVSKRQIEIVKNGLMTLGEVLLAEELEID